VQESKKKKASTKKSVASRSSRGESKASRRKKQAKKTSRASTSRSKVAKRKRSASKASAKKKTKRRRQNTKYSAEWEILEKFTVKQLLTKSKVDLFVLLKDSTHDKASLSAWLRDVFLKPLGLTFSLGGNSKVVRKTPKAK
jgi:hypothetical protein